MVGYIINIEVWLQIQKDKKIIEMIQNVNGSATVKKRQDCEIRKLDILEANHIHSTLKQIRTPDRTLDESAGRRKTR